MGDILFEPLAFRTLTVKNRIMRSSISGRIDNYDGSGTLARIRWEEKFARGGVGCIISAHVPVHVRGRILPHYAFIDRDERVPFWRKVGEAVHALDCKFIIQIAHSGRQLAEHPEPAQLERVFRTIEDRAKHLHSFIDGYARFAKLPRPRPEEVDWGAFLRALQETAQFRLVAAPPTRTAVFDPTQMEQVLINLVKNAREAGAPADTIDVEVNEHAGGWRVQVLDRGSGMTDEVLRGALLPFYSTKPSGAGLGLTICREVVEAHGGRISLANRPDGGLAATLWIPAIAPE